MEKVILTGVERERKSREKNVKKVIVNKISCPPVHDDHTPSLQHEAFISRVLFYPFSLRVDRLLELVDQFFAFYYKMYLIPSKTFCAIISSSTHLLNYKKGCRQVFGE